MIECYLQSVGVVAAGISDWPSCRDLLLEKGEYRPEPLSDFNPYILPANERRRVTPTIRIALHAAMAAMENSDCASSETAVVFASTNGDLDITDRLCTALISAGRPVSPIDFHNSVHNAPAGYWTIASHCHLPSTAISAGPMDFTVGFLDAVAQTQTNHHPVLVVVYDLPAPDILARHLPQQTAFASAMVLSRQKTKHSLAHLRVRIGEHATSNTLRNSRLELLRQQNPAAQALVLLERVAFERPGRCALPYLESSPLLIEYTPC